MVAGFEPLDILQSMWMVLKQIAEGRCEVENQYGRIVPRGRQRAGARRDHARSSSCANSSSGAASARSTIPACGCARPTPLRRRAPLRGAEPEDRRPEVLPVRRGAEGRDQAAASARSSARACTPETPLGALMVSSEGACAAYYQYGAHRPRPAAAQDGARGMNDRARPPVATATAPPQRLLRDERITLAHGGGGRAMRDLIDDVFVSALRQPAARRRWRTRRASRWPRSRALGDRLAFTTDSYVVDRRCSSPAATSARWRSAAPSTTWRWRRAAAVPVVRPDHRGRPAELEALRRVVAQHGAHAPKPPALQIVTGDTKVVERGAADRLFINTAGIGVMPAGRRHRGAPRAAGRRGASSTARSATMARRS